ncbi:hypothetical protein I7822_05880 [Metabacillus sp. BG109]|uniref:Integrase catalytic domain-containing protein n=1 Tax=Metabacillus bambusae TaxID=2795218 RepID=A0ABS3MYW5_9BACI|nr:hypothetical protein [Metabacillus bambusae]
MIVSRRRIGRIISPYTVPQFKPQKDKCNESVIHNKLNREFDQDEERAVIVNDLTNVRVNQKWNYICLFIDLFNREIAGFSTEPNKDTYLVYRAFSSIHGNLERISSIRTEEMSSKTS